MIRHNLYFLILISMVLVDASVIRQAKTDDICGRISGVLCVNDTLAAIVETAMKTIAPLAQIIEEDIIGVSDIDRKYYNLLEKKIDSMQVHLPPTFYHSEFAELSNIDQVDFLGNASQFITRSF